MTDELISYETAKLAKEKRFDVKTPKAYYDHGGTQVILWVDSEPLNSELAPAPTQSLLQRWLRDAHNIDLWAQPFVFNLSLPDESYSYFIYKDGVLATDSVGFIDFEEALEAGLLEALKVIKNE